MEVRREEIESFLAIMERSARAQERLIELATEERKIEFQPTPPFCPHCQALNPRVGSEGGGVGTMTDFVLVARCGECGNALYGVPESWQVYGTPEAARAALEAIKEAGSEHS